MATDQERDRLRATLRRWGRQQRDRDHLVLAAIAAGIPKEEIHVLMGIGRMTIDRIQAKGTRDVSATKESENRP